MASASASPAPEIGIAPKNRHVQTPVEKQRMQLERLLKDPAKPAYVPPPPKEKTIRPPREMMKNVQGSSAGAGSGEFHVYKASRRREYERLKLMDEETQKLEAESEFEKKKRQWEEEANAKTAKNRAKRMKKKERVKTKGADGPGKSGTDGKSDGEVNFKKRRLVDGQAIAFKKPGEDDDEDSDEEGPQMLPQVDEPPEDKEDEVSVPVVETGPRIIIHDDD